MGVGEQKARAEAFEQKTDKAYDAEIAQAGLFGKSIETAFTVDCMRDPQDAPCNIGESVRLVDMQKRIDVFVKFESIGYVIDSDTNALRSQMGIDQTQSRSLQGTIIEISDITPTFTVQLA